MEELRTRGAPCLCGSACAHPPEPPRGHVCVHTRVRHAGWARRRCTRVRWTYSTPSVWIISGVFPAVFRPLPRLCGCVWCRGGGGAAGTRLLRQRPRPPAACKATIHPFIYSNINIFAFRPQPKRDKALPRGLSIPPRLIRLQTQLGSLGMALDAFVLPKRA